MNKTAPIQLGGKTYNLRFGAVGAYLLQRETEQGILEFAAKVDQNRLGFMDLHALLWAELESARKADHQAPVPWTIDSVGEAIDGECDGDLVEFWRTKSQPVLEAFRASFSITIKKQEELQRRAAKVAANSKKGGEAGDPPQAAELTGDSPLSGTTASTLPPRSGSRKTRSGR